MEQELPCEARRGVYYPSLGRIALDTYMQCESELLDALNASNLSPEEINERLIAYKEAYIKVEQPH